ncbi:ribonuclease H-like domain-containing protein [Tanacetum coccineum]
MSAKGNITKASHWSRHLKEDTRGCKETHKEGNFFALNPLLKRHKYSDTRIATSAYAIISSEQSHRVVSSSGVGTSQRSQSSVFSSNVGNMSNAQRPQTSVRNSRPSNATRPVNSRNRRPNRGSPLPAHEQTGTIFDSVANQHLTYTDKNLVNSIDISYIGIKVSHPNGTEALITKVARDSKFIVGFDESKCFLMSHDLMDVKIMEIGRQVNGLYYYDNVEGGIPLNLWSKCILTACYLINSRAEKCVLVGYSSFKKGYKLFSLERKQFIFSRDVKIFEKVFSFKTKHDSVVKTSQDLDHVNFFNEVVHEGPDTSYDDISLNAHDHSDGSHSSQPSNPTIDHYESDLGHSRGSNGSASESERVAISDHNTSLSEDDVVVDDATEHVHVLNNQPLRRSERASVFPNKYNDYVVDSNVKYRLEKYVGYSNLTSEISCFTTELNKAFESKNYWEACKDQHWIEAMNKEIDALYRNDT